MSVFFCLSCSSLFCLLPFLLPFPFCSFPAPFSFSFSVSLFLSIFSFLCEHPRSSLSFYRTHALRTLTQKGRCQQHLYTGVCSTANERASLLDSSDHVCFLLLVLLLSILSSPLLASLSLLLLSCSLLVFFLSLPSVELFSFCPVLRFRVPSPVVITSLLFPLCSLLSTLLRSIFSLYRFIFLVLLLCFCFLSCLFDFLLIVPSLFSFSALLLPCSLLLACLFYSLPIFQFLSLSLLLSNPVLSCTAILWLLSSFLLPCLLPMTEHSCAFFLLRLRSACLPTNIHPPRPFKARTPLGSISATECFHRHEQNLSFGSYASLRLSMLCHVVSCPVALRTVASRRAATTHWRSFTHSHTTHTDAAHTHRAHIPTARVCTAYAHTTHTHALMYFCVPATASDFICPPTSSTSASDVGLSGPSYFLFL